MCRAEVVPYRVVESETDHTMTLAKCNPLRLRPNKSSVCAL